MTSEQDDLLFAEEQETLSAALTEGGWKILLVDDETEIHTISRLVLGDFVFMNRSLDFISAYSGREAMGIMRENPDIAVILLDVVMEDEHAGLRVVEYIRNELRNHHVRIVLRTGQPGQAPETRVIVEYDINDYKEKSELTSQKLFTLLYSTLRSYRDILTIEAHRQGLEKIILASAGIFGEQHHILKLAEIVMQEITGLLPEGTIRHGFIAADGPEEPRVLCGNGRFAALGGTAAGEYPKITGEEATDSALTACLHQGKSRFSDNASVLLIQTHRGVTLLVYLEHGPGLEPIYCQLLEVIATNIGIAFDNLFLNRDIEDTQREIVYMLGEAVETRSKETGNHVKRVANVSKLLALEMGVDEEEAEIIRMASPMHDLGKVGIPDAILNKPGKLTAEEMEVMKTHATIGYEVLKKSNRKALQMAAVIAHEHHEKWDGSGYPRGLAGEDIALAGRITAVADVFDALCHKRCYKAAWSIDDVVNFFREQRGRHFDPRLVDILFENLDRFQAIMDAYAD